MSAPDAYLRSARRQRRQRARPAPELEPEATTQKPPPLVTQGARGTIVLGVKPSPDDLLRSGRAATGDGGWTPI